MKKGINKGEGEDQEYVMYTQSNRKRKICKKNIATGSWTTKENQIYLSFLKSNINLFQNEFTRRSTKVFRKMSSLLRKRDPEQCRSHHQKLIIKYGGNLELVMEKLKYKIQKGRRNIQEGKAKQGKKYQKSFPTGDIESIKNLTYHITSVIQGQIDIVLNLDNIIKW